MKTQLSIAVAWMLLAAAPCRAQLSDGLYAVFHTGMGSFTARLHYAEAPMTVGNFVGLAGGTRAWIDEATGAPRAEPFFDGTIVNRIANVFGRRIVQTGSRNGTTVGGGPGYTFPDEFSPLLRHDRAGAMSMANSGLNSNGSQYFFSMSAIPELDDRYTVFGEVVSGLNVLTDISNVPLDGVKPVDDVVFQRVEIVRVGTAASNFVASAQGLPVVGGSNVAIARAGSADLRVTYDGRSNSFFTVYSSGDGRTWSMLDSAWHIDVPPPPAIDFLATDPAAFFSVGRVDYAGPLFTPTDVAPGLLAATDGEVDIELNAGGGGSVYFYDRTYTGIIVYATWDQQAYRGVLDASYANVFPPRVRLSYAFTNATSGSYAGALLNANGTQAAELRGSFVYTRP